MLALLTMINKIDKNNKNKELNEIDRICEECLKEDESVRQNLILKGFKICNSCSVSKTIFPI